MTINTIYAASRIRMEESLLLREFGSEYIDYKQRVGAFWPWLWCDCGVPMEEANALASLKSMDGHGDDDVYMDI